MARCAGGGIILFSVATRYQLGLIRQAGSVIDPPRASTPTGNLRVGHERGLLGGQIAGERRGKLLSVQEQEAVLRRQGRSHRRAGRRVSDERIHRLARVRRECCDVHQCRHVRVRARLGDDRSAVGVADENDRAVLRNR